jgi:hypothetical protein
MICAIGLGILGFVALRRAHRRCHAGACGNGSYGYGWRGPWGAYGHRHGRRRWMLHAMFNRLDATPAQERAIVNEIERLEERVRGAKAGLKDTRGDLAAALRGPALDDAALGAVLGRIDGTTGEIRSAAIDALRGIHAVLDDKQRAELADLLDRDRGWWRGGPYR